MNVDPITDEEWREAALLARGALLFHSAKLYGLVSGGPVVDVPRCEELFARALARGIEVDDDEAAVAFVHFANDEVLEAASVPGGRSE